MYITSKQIKFIIPSNPVIPLNLFQTWRTGSNNLPAGMLKTVNMIKSLNPEFNYFLYSDEQCLEFIKKYFPSEVATAYINLIPGAFKADLWRYCILYIKGGIYVDIKFKPENNFKFIYLTGREYFVLEKPSPYWKKGDYGIYNGFMICKPKNHILLKCIQKIVNNVKNQDYGYSELYPTGPGLLGSIYFNTYYFPYNFELFWTDNIIIYKGKIILQTYPEYRKEQSNEPKVHYSIAWAKKEIYKN